MCLPTLESLMGTAHGANVQRARAVSAKPAPGRLHRVLPRIWPYLGKYYELDLKKYSARPITLSHDGNLTNGLLRVKRGTLEMRIAVSRE
jgi:hypothetical protein